MQKYNHKKIEAKWQAYWAKKKIFQAKDFAKKPKKYVLAEFPYPSGEGLHMGHLRPYVAGDVYSRFKRMQGNEVLYPMGWDAFGLPAENYAIKKGIHPSVTTKKNISNAKKQMQSWGLSFDWSREINTTDPDYYKWTQWLFLQFYKAGLAYEATGLINWCPKDKTGLANEEVIDGKCERCGTVVEKKELRQWYLKITAYAEKLLEGLKNLPQWPEAVKLQQENWIGKSVGAEISFGVIPSATEESLKPNFLILHGRNGSPNSHTFPWLKSQLESKGYKVQAPMLPNTDEPNDIEQTEFVLKNCVIDENTVIIGHSFGGIVALRLLEKGIKAKQVVLMCTPFYGKFLDKKSRPSVTRACQKGFDFNKIKTNAKNFMLLYDTGDYVVPMSDGEAFAEKLNANLLKLKGQKPHLSGKTEPEVLRALLSDYMIKVFTTRLDTIFSGTFIVLAPEHPLVKFITAPERKNAVEQYIEKTKKLSDQQRQDVNLEKTGVFTGSYAINSASGGKMPIWISDFVIGSYGTGAVFADAHDERDFEMAKKFNIPLKVSIKPKDEALWEQVKKLETCFSDEGTLVNSGQFDGLTSAEARDKILEWLEQKGSAKKRINYKLRDWVFSRQRYWGEPIPIIHCEKCGIVPVPDKDLPVKLPMVKNYQPTGTGESPLAAVSKWVNVKCPVCKSSAKREANTMPNWAGSSWYWLRYTDPKDKKVFADLKKQKYWTPVDVYFGGMEHTTLHLLYSRFWNLFLYDQGLVTSLEPYNLRKPHGIILGPDGDKMSKSRGNVVNPQDIVASHGADTLRMFELFLGPHEDTIAWNDKSVVGVKRFLDRVWNWAVPRVTLGEPQSRGLPSEKVERALNKLIKKITEDIENFHFNTSISAFMEFYNEVKDETVSTESVKTFLKLLYPFAPHISEELNQLVDKTRGHAKSQQSLQDEKWPLYDPKFVVDKTVEIVVQINGRVKGKLAVDAGSSQQQVSAKILELDPVKQALINETIKRTIFVPDRLINLVI
jgi:leucyl-tRNA synthetase